MVKGRLKTDRILITWAILTALWNYLSNYTNIHNLTTYSYTALALFWVYSLKDEIPNVYMRRNMSLGGIFLTLLFIFRFIKYNLVTPNTFPHRLMWYGYYIPILITPLLSLMISLDICSKNHKQYRMLLSVLKILCAVLLVVVLTNDIHGLAIKIWYEGDNEYSSLGIFYYLVIIWYVALMLASFIIALRKCILSSYKKHWGVPVAIEMLGLFLWGWYYLVCRGSSPKLGSYGLYNIQEVYVLLFIGFWESMICVGLIPTVSLAKDRTWISDRIFGTVKEEISEIQNILDQIKCTDDESFRDGMIRITFIGVYIKRRANLELITTKTGFLSSYELSLAIREALDYFDFSRLSVGFEESGESVDIPMLLICGIFELLKNIISKTVSACYVKLVTGKEKDTVSIALMIEADMNLTDADISANNPAPLADKELFNALGASLNIHEEDDTWNVHVSATYPDQIDNKKAAHALYKESRYSLSQIASYLSLEKEALQAKTRIHDSLGRCLLATKAYLNSLYPISRDAIITGWYNIITDMSTPPHHRNLSDTLDSNYFLSEAKNMGIDVVLSGQIPDDTELRRVIDTALTVHITNVLRHAAGNKAYVKITTDDNSYIFSFTNNGKAPDGKITEKGGLKNLRKHVEAIGGTMAIEWVNGFNMILTFPKNTKNEGA